MPTDRATPTPRAIVAPLYFIGALLILLPLVDLAVNVWPLQPGDYRWRFGVVGLLASFLLTPLLGVAVLAGAAELAPSGRRIIGWVNVAGGVALVAAIGLFALDLIQLRPILRPEAVASFDVANVRAIAKLLLGAVALLWLGIVGMGGRARAAAR